MLNFPAITIGRIKIPFSDVVTAILKLDEEILNPGFVTSLLKIVPTAEEVRFLNLCNQPFQIEMLKAYPDPPSTLDKPEQFILEVRLNITLNVSYLEQIMKVPRLQTRLEAFSFRQQFTDKLSETEPVFFAYILYTNMEQPCKAVCTASKQLLESKKLTRFLEAMN